MQAQGSGGRVLRGRTVRPSTQRLRGRPRSVIEPGFFFATALLLTLSAAAQPSDSRVQLTLTRDAGAEACPDEAALRRELGARLGHDPVSAGAPRRAELVVFRRRDALFAELTLTEADGTTGTRTLGPDDLSCAQLREDLLLTLAIAIDPLRALTPAPSPAPEEPVEVPTTPSLATIAETSAEPAGSEPAAPLRSPDSSPAPGAAAAAQADGDVGPRLELSLGAVGTVAAAPQVAAGLRASVGVVVDEVAAHVAVWGTFPAAAQLPAQLAPGRVSTFLTVVDLLACGRVGPVELCGVGSVGGSWAAAAGLPEARTENALHIAAGARVAATWMWSDHFGLRPALEIRTPLRATDVFVGDERVWQMPPASGLLTLELVWAS